jgi:hypothetical protein
MVQPYNYAIQAPSAFESLVSGLKLGTSLQEMQAQRQLREAQAAQIQQKMEADRAKNLAMQEFRAKPFSKLTQGDIAGLQGLLPPEAVKGIKDAFDSMRSDERRSRAGQLGEMASVALSGKPDAVDAWFAPRIDAEQDPAQRKALEAWKQSAKINPQAFAKTLVTQLSLSDDGREVAKNLIEMYGLKAPEPLSPEAQREAVAKADKAVADAISAQATATTAQERAAADLRRAQAEAQKAEVQARVQAAEEKVAGGIELTPELRTAIGSTKLPADQQRALLDLAAAKAPKTAFTIQGEAEAGAFGKSLVARFDKIREQADLSTSQLANLDVAQKVLDDGFKTGFGTEWEAAAASVLSSLGVQNATRFATNAQLFLAQSRSALLTKQLEQKGPQTENDAKRIDQTFASLGNTLEANKFLIAHARAMALRNRELVTFWQKYRRENRTFDGAQEAYEEGPGAKSIFDYAPLKPFASVVPESVWSTAPMPTITPPATQAAPVTPATAPRGPRPSLNDIFR